MKNQNTKKEVVESKEDLLSNYNAQTEDNEDIHFEHVDWTYSDGSCCC